MMMFRSSHSMMRLHLIRSSHVTRSLHLCRRLTFPLGGLRLISSKSIYRPFTALLNVLLLLCAFYSSPSPLGSEFPLRGLRLISSKSIYRPFTALLNVLLLPCAFYRSPSPLQERSFLSEDLGGNSFPEADWESSKHLG